MNHEPFDQAHARAKEAQTNMGLFAAGAIASAVARNPKRRGIGLADVAMVGCAAGAAYQAAQLETAARMIEASAAAMVAEWNAAPDEASAVALVVRLAKALDAPGVDLKKIVSLPADRAIVAAYVYDASVALQPARLFVSYLADVDMLRAQAVSAHLVASDRGTIPASFRAFVRAADVRFRQLRRRLGMWRIGLGLLCALGTYECVYLHAFSPEFENLMGWTLIGVGFLFGYVECNRSGLLWRRRWLVIYVRAGLGLIWGAPYFLGLLLTRKSMERLARLHVIDDRLRSLRGQTAYALDLTDP